MAKKSFKKSVTSTIAIMTVALAIFGIAAVNKAYAVDIQPPVSIWIDPPTLNFTSGTTHINDKFNVTVWVNTENGTVSQAVFTWQLMLTFNSTLLTCTNVGYTGTGKSQFFGNSNTIPVSPIIAADSVTHGETLLAGDKSGNGSLIWLEFQIMMEPNETTGALNSVLSLSGAPASDTFLLDPDLIIISPLSVYNATYSYSLPLPDTTPPTIDAPLRTPSGSVPENETVTIAANITDNVGGSGVANATLSYTIDNSTWTNAAMNSSGNTWTGTVPGKLNGTRVWYKITAFDGAENNATKYESGTTPYYYDVVPEFMTAVLIVMLTGLAGAMVVYRKKLVRLP
jgi:hypothetical protein